MKSPEEAAHGSEIIKARHDHAVRNVETWSPEIEKAKEAIALLTRIEGAARVKNEDTESGAYRAIVSELKDQRQHMNNAALISAEARLERKAALLDAKEDLSNNREAYESAAIADASAAGVVLGITGVEYRDDSSDTVASIEQ